MIQLIRKINILIAVLLMTVAKAKGQAVTVSNLAVTITSGLTATISGDFKNQASGTIDNAGTITVTGNWTNNASNNVFSTNTGTVQFIGTAAQTITGTYSTSFYNLTLNNSYSSATRYTLGINQTVKNTLTLSTGELNLATYTLTLGTSAASPGSLSYIAGWMYGGTFKRWFATSTIANGASAGLFPIGTSTDYRPLYVSAPSTAPTAGGTISVTHTNIANTTASSFTDVNITIARIFNSYWTVTTANGLAGGTYNLRTDGTGFTGVTDYTTLRLVLAGSYVGTYGTNAGNNTTPQVNRTGITLSQLSNNFYWGYPTGSGPLPIDLIEFTVSPQLSAVKTNWTTASEINSDFFNVERSSDGVLYESICPQQAAGNSTDIKFYSAIDNNPLCGISYYRLKETDFDGSVTYSSPVAVNFKNNKSELEILSANSTDNKITVNINSSASENFILNFYDVTGKLISETRGNLKTGNQNIVISSFKNAKGLYLITLITQNSTISKKVI